MKYQITFFAILVSLFTAFSQNQNIETQSVLVDQLIPFIIDHIESKDDDSEASNDQITFLLQTPIGDVSIEDKVILKQAFKLISQRLSENDHISIITYSGFNGIALHTTSAKDVKQVLYTIENLKSSINEFHKDGIELAYNYASENYESESLNRIIMIRNPSSVAPGIANMVLDNSTESSVTTKKNNTVLLTAITLLPQLIAVIKD